MGNGGAGSADGSPREVATGCGIEAAVASVGSTGTSSSTSANSTTEAATTGTSGERVNAPDSTSSCTTDRPVGVTAAGAPTETAS